MKLFFIISALLGVMALAIFGIRMPADETGMAGCPFMTDHSVICTMAPLAHFAMWQSFFHVVVDTGMLLIFIAIAVVLAAASFDIHDQFFERWRFRFSSWIDYRLHTYFSWLFSDGILHPKNA